MPPMSVSVLERPPAQSVGSDGGPAVELQDLPPSYHPSREALAGVSLSIARGEIFGLLGPNGGGKSTLFRILSTLLLPSSGTARVCGVDVARDPHGVRRATR